MHIYNSGSCIVSTKSSLNIIQYIVILLSFLENKFDKKIENYSSTSAKAFPKIVSDIFVTKKKKNKKINILISSHKRIVSKRK